jgi:hypothetical protein
MNITDRINADLKEAMKAKDEVRLRGIRAVKAAILLANTDGTGKEMDEERGIAILQRLVKQRKESLEMYQKNNRPELAKIEQDEIDVIQAYLPQQMSREELTLAISQIIERVGATSPKDMGKVMGATKELAGKAEGKVISEIVKEILAAK